MRMRVENRIRFCTALLAGAAALTLGCEFARKASWKLEATAEASQQMPRRTHLPFHAPWSVRRA